MNTASLLVFDGLLLFSIVGLAWASLATSDERRSVILFMAFGLVLAVAWGRLLAPDVALAEAAIGAGLSGALLLAAVRKQPPPAVATVAPMLHRYPGAAPVSMVVSMGGHAVMLPRWPARLPGPCCMPSAAPRRTRCPGPLPKISRPAGSATR